MAQFGEILAELRKDHKMSQKELAKIIYVSTGTISNYETGTHFPDVEKLIALADAAAGEKAAPVYPFRGYEISSCDQRIS